MKHHSFLQEGQGFQNFNQYSGPTQTFDYSHQPPPVNQQAGPPPTLGGPMTFDYEHGRAPLPEGAPPLPVEMPNPTIPQAPYFDLPAGLMVPLIKVLCFDIIFIYQFLDWKEFPLTNLL